MTSMAEDLKTKNPSRAGQSFPQQPHFDRLTKDDSQSYWSFSPAESQKFSYLLHDLQVFNVEIR